MRLLISLFLIVGLSSMLLAQVPDIELDLHGSTFYNVLRVSSFDVKNPANQPVFFTVTLRNNTAEPLSDVYLAFTLHYGDEVLIDSKVKYRETLLPNIPRVFTNRDIFNESGSNSFERPSPSISISDVFDGVPHLRDAVLNTGLFPDGRYQFKLRVIDGSETLLSEEKLLVFTVRNPGGIYLIRPGVSPGRRIPEMSGKPINFIWSSNLAGTQENKFRLLIKEFDEPSMLSPGFIETGGNVVLDVSDLTNSFYSEYIPFREGSYYAWQVSTPLLDPATSYFTSAADVRSPFYVFRYSSEGSFEDEASIQAINNFLKTLGIPAIMSLLGDGYNATGVIEYNGNAYTGTEAEELLRELLDRSIKSITITD